MATSSLSEKLRQKLHLKEYLQELEALTGRAVQAGELGSLEQVATIRQIVQKFDAQPVVAFETAFSDRTSERFKRFVERLRNANSSPVYVWTPRTISCGALIVSSLDAVQFGFDFAINKEGILVFLTSDLEDRLLLDFSTTPTGEQCMRVETQGTNWAKIAF